MRLKDVKKAIKDGKIVVLRDSSPFSGTKIATVGTFITCIKDKDIREILSERFKASKNEIVSWGEFGWEAEKKLNQSFFGIAVDNDEDIDKLEALVAGAVSNIKEKERFWLTFRFQKEQLIHVNIADIWQEVVEEVQKNLMDLLDLDPVNLPFELLYLGLVDEKKLPLERKWKKYFQIAVAHAKGVRKEPLMEHIVLQVLRLKRRRYTVLHDAIKLAVRGMSRDDENLPIKLLQDGNIARIDYYLGEEEKRPLSTYHLVALFDLLLAMIHSNEIQARFAIAKKGVKGESVITNELIKSKLGVSDYQASLIKKALYELSSLVIVFETKDGSRAGIFPIRRIGFIENSDDKLDFFEVDRILLHNGKYFVPLIPNTFVRLLKALPSRTSELGSKVLLYLLETRNFETNKCFMSARSFSKKFPNSYAERRRWAELHRVLGQILQALYEERIVRDFRDFGEYFEVEVRS